VTGFQTTLHIKFH